MGNEILFSHHFEEKYLFGKLTRLFTDIFSAAGEGYSILCIGIDRSTGDGFGPLTGTLLEQKNVPNVYGTLEHPVHAKNLTEVYKRVRKDKKIIAVDASLGSASKIGYLTVYRGGILPGKAFNNNLPVVGDISVILNVNMAGIANYLCLQTASLYMVWQSANTLSRAIHASMYISKKEKLGT